MNLRSNGGSKAKIDNLVRELEKLNKSLSKTRVYAQGNFDFASPIVSEFQSMLSLLKSGEFALPDGVDKEVAVKIISSLTASLYSMHRDRTCLNISIQLTNLAVQYLPLEFVSRFIEMICEASKVVYSKFESIVAQSEGEVSDADQSLADRIWSFLSGFTEVLNDARWEQLKEFFLKVSALFYSAKGFASYDQLDLKTAFSKFDSLKVLANGGKTVLDGLVESYLFVVKNWDCIISGDWSCFLLGKDEAVDFEKRVQELQQAGSLLMRGRVTELKDLYSLDEESLLVALKLCIKKGDALTKRTTSSNAKLALQRYMTTLRSLETDLYLLKNEAPSRPEPFGLKLHGPSKCGKSQLVTLISQVIASANNRDFDPSDTVYSNINERFESNVMPNHKLIVCDDVANNAQETPNYDRVLNYVNVVPRPLEKAGVEEKGKLFPCNDSLIVTTNVDDLRATKASACAESILRRFKLHVDVAIRPEFRNEFGGLIDLPELNLSVYELTLKRFSHIEVGNKVVWDILSHDEWNPTGDHSQDVNYFLKFLRKDILAHKKARESMRRSQEAIVNCGQCDSCHLPTIVCICNSDSNEDAVAQSVFSDVIATSTENLLDVKSVISGKFSSLWNTSSRLMTLSYVVFLWKTENVLKALLTGWLSSLVLMSIFSLNIFFAFVSGVFILFCARFYVLKSLNERISKRRDQFSAAVLTTKAYCAQYAPHAFACVAVVIAIQQLWKFARSRKEESQDTSTYLRASHPLFKKLINSPDEKYYRPLDDVANYKEGYTRLPPKLTKLNCGTSSEQLSEMIENRLRVVVIKSEGKIIHTVNGILVSGNIIMVPDHVIPRAGLFDVETTPHPGMPCDVTKDQRITSDMVWRHPEKDVALVHLASSPAGTNLVRFFPDEVPSFSSRATVLITKLHDKEKPIRKSLQAIRPYVGSHGSTTLKYSGTTYKSGLLRNGYGSETLEARRAFTCDLEFETYEGLCGGIYLDRSQATIYGFHVAGIPDSTQGFLTTITSGLLQEGIASLNKTSPCMVLADKGPVTVNAYGTPYEVVDGTPHFLRAEGLGESAICTYHGKVVKDGAPLVEAVKVPYIPSPFNGVEENFGKPQSIPPTAPNSVDKGLKTLNKLQAPVQHKEMDILKLAIDDLKAHLSECVTANMDEAKSLLKVYSVQEALDGVGASGFSGMPNGTSAGWPLNCSKRKVMEKDPLDESLPKVPREFTDDFDVVGKIEETWEAWSKGQRSEPIFRASSKVNELLPKAKAIEKVRKFYGSPIDFLVNSRRMLGGLVLFMRNHQEEFECFVGMNPNSYEWGDFHKYVTRFGGERMIAGDFSGFDTTMSQQVSSAAAGIIVDIYRQAGMAEDDLVRLSACLSDICNPNVLFMGDLYNFANMNPSGQPITVQLNSIVNSLLMRYVYYAIYPKSRSSFATHVSLATYGDDNLMDVSRSAPKYTHTNCQHEFAKIGIKYTMADKEAKSQHYIKISEASFLKRGFSFNSDLNAWVAPIEEESIIKKFHFVKKPTESPLSFEDQFGAYCDGAFREAFLYGKDYYISFSSKIKDIVSRNNSLHGKIAFLSYEEMTPILSLYFDRTTYRGHNPVLYAQGVNMPINKSWSCIDEDGNYIFMDEDCESC